MADGHGGYRKPANPAPSSGPGALSQRTDGGVGAPQVSGLGYGENGPLNAAAASLPVAGPQRAAPSIVPLDAPTAMPNEPITAGAPFGPGPGPSPRTENGRLTAMLESLLGDDIVGGVEELYLYAERMGL